MNNNVFRWLHLSDFHVGKDKYGEKCSFDYILENIKTSIREGLPLMAVFITGDIANSGQGFEYELFFENFLGPLDELMAKTEYKGKIFMVPGNHDVARDQARAVKTHGVLDDVPSFLDPTNDAMSERIHILPRFKAYMDYDVILNGKSHWISSFEGSFVKNITVDTKKIGVLGLNSAWLSSGDSSDRHKLSPGKGILEQGLNKLEDSDLIFVLSHHPIDWFLDSEVQSIKTMLMRKNVIYLYGHLHKIKGESNFLNSGSYLQIQAGAAFQAREDVCWHNRIIWGETNIEKQSIKVQPLLWSRDNQEWAIDSEAFPKEYHIEDQGYWNLPFPKTKEISSKISNSTKNLQDMLPSGWIVVNKDFLNPFQERLSDEEVIKFFDGRVPGWKDALSLNIPRRSKVSDIVARIEEQLANNSISLFIVKGAGGEGKSTILRQTIVELLNKGIVEQILWNENAELDVPNLNTIIPNRSGACVIASDDAENIAGKLFNIIKDASKRGMTKLCVLIAVRDTDWIASKCDEIPWDKYVTPIEILLRGLSAKDAEEIITAWSKYDKQGLGKLYGLTHDDAVRELLKEAHLEANSTEGAFLGAMLRTRIGDDIREHVKNLLHHLKKSDAPGGSLLEGFAHIAVPHALNILTLSREPLARTLGCHRKELKEKVLGPLGEEAVVASSGSFILTRHRAIAEAAVDVLSKEFYIDTDEIIIDLMKATLELYDLSVFIPNVGEWQNMSSRLFYAGKRELV